MLKFQKGDFVEIRLMSSVFHVFRAAVFGIIEDGAWSHADKQAVYNVRLLSSGKVIPVTEIGLHFSAAPYLD